MTYNLYCSIPECKYKYQQITRAHHCQKCYQNHSIKNCPLNVDNLKNNNYELDCPICKKINIFEKGTNIMFGNETTCSVCLDNNVNIYLPKCGHACLCESCLNKMDKNKDKNSESFKIYLEEELPKIIVSNAKKKMFQKEDKIYVVEYGGMGCNWYLRRDYKDGMILGAFLHSDCMGQYNINDIPLINNFIQNYNQVII